MNRKDNLNLLIKDRRVKLGLTQYDIAEACNMTLSEYRDFEDYDDEIYMVLTLRTTECVCSNLGIKIDELFDSPAQKRLLPKDVICEKMDKKNISILELSDLVGIEESYIVNVRKNLVYLGDWVMDAVVTLSDHLGLNLGLLLYSFSIYRDKDPVGRNA